MEAAFNRAIELSAKVTEITTERRLSSTRQAAPAKLTFGRAAPRGADRRSLERVWRLHASAIA